MKILFIDMGHHDIQALLPSFDSLLTDTTYQSIFSRLKLFEEAIAFYSLHHYDVTVALICIGQCNDVVKNLS